jgi:hypothetical protein
MDGPEIHKCLGAFRVLFTGPNVKDIISEYLRAFKNGYPKQFGMAEQIKTVVKQNNIFEADGYRQTIVSILGP